jgi:hypothetical protein
VVDLAVSSAPAEDSMRSMRGVELFDGVVELGFEGGGRTVAVAEVDAGVVLRGYELVRARDHTAECARSHDFGAGEIRQSIPRAHAPLEVPVRRRDTDLAILQKTGAKADTGSARSRQWDTPRLKQSLPVASIFSDLLLASRRRRDVQLDTVCDFGDLAIVGLCGILEDLGSCGDVGSPRVCARYDVRPVDLDLLRRELAKRGRDLDRVGAGDVGREGGEVEVELLRVRCAGVSLHRVGVELVDLFVCNPLLGRPVFAHSCLSGLVSEPTLESLVDRELLNKVRASLQYTVVYGSSTHHCRERTPLSRHVADGEPVVYRDTGHGLLGALELNGVVEHVALEQPAQRNDDVLSSNAGRQGPREGYLRNGRSLEPTPAGGED